VQEAAEDRLASLLLRGVEARLSEFLLLAARRWGTPHPSGELVSAPFTHAEMAAVIGSTRETVTLLLGKLRREGLIEIERRRVILRSRDVLERRAVEAP
jgi:CRP-like cAMP-binding protein